MRAMRYQPTAVYNPTVNTDEDAKALGIHRTAELVALKTFGPQYPAVARCLPLTLQGRKWNRSAVPR